MSPRSSKGAAGRGAADHGRADGAQTGVALFKDGTLEKYGVQMIGATRRRSRRRRTAKFRDAMSKIGLESPRSQIAHSLEDACRRLRSPGFRRSSGRASRLADGRWHRLQSRGVRRDRHRGLEASPTTEVLIEESVLGWKEYEMEVVRDRADNAIIICAIENVDPMGVHTGDSITVAPALTLTDKEYQIMRNASIACLREIGVETGGSNVQFAVNPRTGGWS
jgi:carbamoyl-phosphate synthase large subunit